jgi:hypothetical protein
MSPKELKKLRVDLGSPKHRGAKFSLAVELGVDPSKITKALHGLVKDEKFMASLQAKANKLLRKEEAVSA